MRKDIRRIERHRLIRQPENGAIRPDDGTARMLGFEGSELQSSWRQPGETNMNEATDVNRNKLPMYTPTQVKVGCITAIYLANGCSEVLLPIDVPHKRRGMCMVKTTIETLRFFYDDVSEDATVWVEVESTWGGRSNLLRVHAPHKKYPTDKG